MCVILSIGNIEALSRSLHYGKGRLRRLGGVPLMNRGPFLKQQQPYDILTSSKCYNFNNPLFYWLPLPGPPAQ